MGNGVVGVLVLLIVFVAFIGSLKARLKVDQKTAAKNRTEKLRRTEEKAMGWMLGVEPDKPKKKARPVAADIPKTPQGTKVSKQEQMSTPRPERVTPVEAMMGEEDDPYALSADELLEPDRLAWGIVMAEVLDKPKGLE